MTQRANDTAAHEKEDERGDGERGDDERGNERLI
jgi:hypothetical protein